MMPNNRWRTRRSLKIKELNSYLKKYMENNEVPVYPRAESLIAQNVKRAIEDDDRVENAEVQVQHIKKGKHKPKDVVINIRGSYRSENDG